MYNNNNNIAVFSRLSYPPNSPIIVHSTSERAESTMIVVLEKYTRALVRIAKFTVTTAWCYIKYCLGGIIRIVFNVTFTCCSFRWPHEPAFFFFTVPLAHDTFMPIDNLSIRWRDRGPAKCDNDPGVRDLNDPVEAPVNTNSIRVYESVEFRFKIHGIQTTKKDKNNGLNQYSFTRVICEHNITE